MANSTESINTELVLPAILALLLVLAAAAGVWFTQIQPATAGNTAADQPTTTARPAETEKGPQGNPANGQTLFVATCSACHGPEGKGIEGLGKDMTSSQFIAGLSNAELVDFIKAGRGPDDPLNTTGVAMPPKGGNPSLSDGDLLDIVAYIRTIHQ